VDAAAFGELDVDAMDTSGQAQVAPREKRMRLPFGEDRR